MNWLNAIAKLQRDNIGFVLVTVLQTKGSAPRDCAAKMAVTDSQIYDSIGGGNLEYQAINTARDLLTKADTTPRVETFSLGKDLTQCCGGEVVLLFECFPACAFNLVLFGAGHVGKALINILSSLPCRVRWLDSRVDIFPRKRRRQCGNRDHKKPLRGGGILPAECALFNHDAQPRNRF